MIKNYDPHIEILWLSDPDTLVPLACDNTMMDVQKNGVKGRKDTANLIRSIIYMGHTSVLEHVCYGFWITGVSRNFMAQLTRHRMGSFTCSSQHYQDYRGYPMIENALKSMEAVIEDDAQKTQMRLDHRFLYKKIVDHYAKLVDAGVSVHEARQILPGAMGVNILWTVNARSLLNFFKQRLCRRNTAEMFTFAWALYAKIKGKHPQIWGAIGPDCEMDGCRQGLMACDKK